MTHQNFVPNFLKGIGAELGAFESPIPGIKMIYADKFKVFGGKTGEKEMAPLRTAHCK